jgi:isovaleryl-CoA dehydrogenase
MDEMLPDEIRAIRDSVNRFMEREVNPVMDGFEDRGEFPRDLVKKAGDAGFYGCVFPESVGGTDLGYVAATVVSEELARNDVRFAACNNQQGSTCPQCIYAGGSVEQVMKFVPPLLAGETIGMMALTESGGGSDALGNMKTTAVWDGDVYRLNGSKMFASMANETDVGIVLAKTDPDAGVKGVSAFIVEPKKYPGFNARPIDMHGLSKALRTNAVFLDDFVVPVENRLGAEGDGFKIAMRALQPGRVTVAAKALGEWHAPVSRTRCATPMSVNCAASPSARTK